MASDVLVTVTPGRRFSLFNLSGVGLLIEEATGIPSQVVLEQFSLTKLKEFVSRLSIGAGFLMAKPTPQQNGFNIS